MCNKTKQKNQVVEILRCNYYVLSFIRKTYFSLIVSLLFWFSAKHSTKVSPLEEKTNISNDLSVSSVGSLAAACGLDLFIINDQSGSVNEIENQQSRAFITTMSTRVGDLGTSSDASRFSISEYAHAGTWTQYSFASAGTNYTTEVADVILYGSAARTLTGGTSVYRALQDAKTAINNNYISGRTSPKVIFLMTDAYCFQIEGAAQDVAQELKNAGYYIIVMAIGPAVTCTDLNTIASTGGYFSAVDYLTLENDAITLVENIFYQACTNASIYTPVYDLSASLTSFTATGCTPGPGTFSTNYTITNTGSADFNANLKVAFYDADPTSPNANHLITQDVGTQTITAGGGTYLGTLNNAALSTTSTLYAVVNIDGALTANALPLTYSLTSSQLNENTEETTADNFSTSITRVDAGTCAAQAKLSVQVNNSGQTCNNEVIYEVTICNNGNADAVITPTSYADTSFVLTNKDILDVLPESRFMEWQKTLGGTLSENQYGATVVETSDGNYIISTETGSGIGGNKTTAGFGSFDTWVVKLDPKGNILWDKTFGGSGTEYEGILVPTNDGGVLLGTTSGSGISGNKTVASQGSNDFWAIKLDANGGIDWQKGYGGSAYEELNDIQATSDGGYIFSGSSNSGISGDRTEASYGSTDYWIIKVDANGNKLWDKAYGGSGSDGDAHIQPTNDGGYLLAGYSRSPISGVKSENSPTDDYWILKLSSTGTILWENTLGGTSNDIIRIGHTIYETSSGNFIVGGVSASGIGGDKTEALNGSQDIWLVTLNGTTGALTTNKGIGGASSSASFAANMHEVPDGGLILLGSNNGGIGGDKTEAGQGNYDYWLLKIDESSNIEWQKSFGGSALDFGSGMEINSAGDYILVGSSSSGISGDKTEASYGGSDLWVIKYNEGKVLSANDCYTVQYTYDVSGASAGNYDFSVDLIANSTNVAHQDPSISPDNSFTVGTTTGLNGFNGATQTTDNVTIGTVSACPPLNLLSIAVDIPDATVCEQGYTTATVTIINKSGGTFSRLDLALNLTGTGTNYASEPYSLTNNLVLPSINTSHASYPSIDNALFSGSGMDTLSIYALAADTSQFNIDLEIGTGLANLSAQVLNIPTGYSTSNVTNLGTDATGITGEANPTISGTCPAAITAGTASISLNYTVTGATSVQWVSGTNGTFSAPNSGISNYTVNAQDIANGYVDFSLSGSTTNNCETTVTCRVNITGVNYDYGDAPATYDLSTNTVMLAGASTTLTDLYLGTIAPDTEATTSASTMATGDGADEDAMDGVALTKPASGATGFSIPVEVTNNSASIAYLTAFIDWNDDGDFLDTLESSSQITIAAGSGVTTNNPIFDVPNITINNDVFLRLRLSTDSGSINVPFGPAPEGETEDAIIFCTDTDGDTVCDIDDIDDDNDGIRDIDEGLVAEIGVDSDVDEIDDARDADCNGSVESSNPGGNAASIHSYNSAGTETNAIGSDNARSALNTVTDYIVLDLGVEVPTGTIIEIESRVTNNTGNIMGVEESIDAAIFNNLQTYSWGSITTEEIKIYTLSADARYIRITLSTDGGSGAVQIDNVAFQAFSILVCNGVIGVPPPDTDSDGTPDYLDLDSDGDGCYDKIEAGVTGYTTTGATTDSLAATTAGEVGANGLDNDIENNDTQLATTSGSYTITQTNSGTNDFQDGALYSPDCHCSFTETDTDGDGICDSSDIDDDNDGIRDSDECVKYLANNTSTAWKGPTTSTVTYNWSGLSTQTNNSTVNNGILDFHVNNTGADQRYAKTGNASYSISFSPAVPASEIGLYIVDVDNFALTTQSAVLTVTGAATTNDFYASTIVNPSGLNSGTYTASTGAIDLSGNIVDKYILLVSNSNTLVSSLSISFSGDASDTVGHSWFAFSPCDTDTDGIYDYLDLDSDNDGIPDLVEAGGIDTNGDGVIDYPTDHPLSMVDLDGDGLADTYDATDSGGSTPGWTGGTAIANPDSDGDGISDANDLDSDNDGIPDLVELGGVDSNGDGLVDTTTDADGDGFADIYDPNDDGIHGIDSGESGAPLVETNGSGNALNGETGTSLDSDGDGYADHVDLDSDGDGLSDLVEVGGVDTNGDGKVDTTTDADGDGYADIYDTDDDGTAGVEDTNDALLQTGGTDTDGDGKADDTAITFVDGESRSLDSDGDGILDHLDLDSDNDGLSDLVEAGGVDTNGDGKVDTTTDADGDGYADIYDTDDDGTAGVEDASDALLQTGGTDTDSDGKADDTAITFVDGESRSLDSDGDGILDHLDLDSDNDGLSDLVEAGGVDTNGDGKVDTTTDADGDGYADIYDTDDDGTAGVEDASDALLQTGGTDTDSDGKADDTAITFVDGESRSLDSDGDGILDHLDLDSDNDGLSDLVEAGGVDTNGDGKVDTTTDADGDGYADIYDTDDDGTAGVEDASDALLQTGGTDTDGDGKADDTAITFVDGESRNVDSDGDGLADHVDLDSDGDGLSDLVEAGGVDTNGDGLVDTTTDADNDGYADIYDTDDDGTAGVEDTNDALLQTGGTDTDGDGKADDTAITFTDGESRSLDTDGDGILDHLDLDADNDGLSDLVEAGGVDTNGDGKVDTTTDADGDGYADIYDTDDDGTSGVEDANDALLQTGGTDTDSDGKADDTAITFVDGESRSLDTDGDGILDHLDLDADNDGLSDLVEAGGVDSNGDGLVDTTTDADGDGYADIYDTDDDGTAGVEDASDALLQTGGTDTDSDGKADDTAITFVDGESRSLDSDSDGILDHLDLDSDNDGIPDLVEAGGIDTNGNGRVDVATDADGDGYADIYDTDDDGTLGVEDATDALVQTGGTDTDGDGKADDTAITFIDGASNSVDSDGDGKADHLDLDSENDGIPDLIEAGGSDPDNDGRVDTATLPWDADGDGLADIYDEAASDGPTGSGTNGTALIETSADTNSDGKVNSTESMVSGGTSSIDGDGDTYPNHLDLDSDNDGITDVVENASGNTSADHSSGTLDGIVGDNASVTDSNNDGWHDPSTSAFTDTDSDGVPDYLDIDADNDGIPDYLEGVCSTCPTFAAPSGNDTDGDGLLDLYEGLTSANANSGTNTGVSPNEDDNDGSGPADYLDTDSDNDGAYDWTEGFDSNGDGNAVDDIILLAAAYETNNGNPGDYPTTDADADGVPDWLDNQVSTSGYVESTRPPFLNQSSGSWVDANNNGLADIFDSAVNGSLSPIPDTDGLNDHDWRDPATTAFLPVDLVSFSGEEIGCEVVLKWTSAVEEDFRHYEIERSGDGRNFESIGMQGGTGSSVNQTYTFTDQTAGLNNYYRLKLVDIDGAIEYSEVIIVEVECNRLETVTIFPNPLGVRYQTLNINIKSKSTQNIEMSMINALGQSIGILKVDLELGQNRIGWDVTGLASGTYYIQFIGNGKILKNHKFIKVDE